jgi:hypothetical protein
MNNKFLDKVIYQIISETRVIDNKLYTPFLSFLPSHPRLSSPSVIAVYAHRLSNHCKEVYSLNEQEIKYVWTKYLKEVTTLMDKKELTHQEKG